MRAFLPIFAVFAAAFFFTEAASGQATNRYTKAANQLVELINAGDYAGIQAKFNKDMGAELPLDKSSAFFKGLTRQMGKIQKLGEPQTVGGTMVFPAKFEKGMFDMQIALDGHGLISGLMFKPHAAPKPAQAQVSQANRYIKVANQLKDLINAGNYAGIQDKFNKEMDAALPLDKSSEFFKGVTRQAGKIQKFGEPQPVNGAMVFPTEFEKSTLDMHLALDGYGLIAGLAFKPHAEIKPDQLPVSQANRHTKMANKLVELINAGDCPGIQARFNKDMEAALPLDKSSEFFKGLTQQMGKIQKLGKPQAAGEAMVFPAEFEKGTLDMHLALDGYGLIAGLAFTPHATTKPEPETQ